MCVLGMAEESTGEHEGRHDSGEGRARLVIVSLFRGELIPPHPAMKVHTLLVRPLLSLER